MAVTETDAEAALDAATADFAVGAVGAGTGMSCFGFKGGIGSASRKLQLERKAYHLGVLVLANFGRAGDLRLPDGRRVDPASERISEQGSIIVVIATDIPLDHRQLHRVIRRAGAGLARCASFFGNGSGDVFLGFTTANRVPHQANSDLLELRCIAESRIDRLFEATADATQEAVLDALAAADSMTGRDGHHRPGLRHFLERNP
jgi:D-aminopeptidase